MYLGDALGTESHVRLAITDSAENFRLLNRNGSADRRLLDILLRDQIRRLSAAAKSPMKPVLLSAEAKR